jgi:hypothetical protein
MQIIKVVCIRRVERHRQSGITVILVCHPTHAETATMTKYSTRFYSLMNSATLGEKIRQPYPEEVKEIGHDRLIERRLVINLMMAEGYTGRISSLQPLKTPPSFKSKTRMSGVFVPCESNINHSDKLQHAAIAVCAVPYRT